MSLAMQFGSRSTRTPHIDNKVPFGRSDINIRELPKVPTRVMYGEAIVQLDRQHTESRYPSAALRIGTFVMQSAVDFSEANYSKPGRVFGFADLTAWNQAGIGGLIGEVIEEDIVIKPVRTRAPFPTFQFTINGAKTMHAARHELPDATAETVHIPETTPQLDIPATMLVAAIAHSIRTFK